MLKDGEEPSYRLTFDLLVEDQTDLLHPLLAPYCGWQRNGGPEELRPILIRSIRGEYHIDFGADYDEPEFQRFNRFQLEDVPLRIGSTVRFIEDDDEATIFVVSAVSDLMAGVLVA